jgi:hypothetical protein
MTRNPILEFCQHCGQPPHVGCLDLANQQYERLGRPRSFPDGIFHLARIDAAVRTRELFAEQLQEQETQA